MGNKNQELYNEEFYNLNRAESYNSARIVLDIFKNFFMPTSVFDLGCGAGTWLRAWQDLGVKDIYGIDANTMDEAALLVPREKIKIIDFENESLEIKKFDLAMSLECLEHISENRELCAVETLTSCADIILFSAAVPMQAGTNHINCRPLQYWVDIFSSKGFSCYDFIRPECIKHALPVAPWYVQNILVFAKNEKCSLLESKGANPVQQPVMFYHTKIFDDIITMTNNKKLQDYGYIVEDHFEKIINNAFIKNKDYFIKELYNNISSKIEKNQNQFIYKLSNDIINNIENRTKKYPKCLINIICCFIPKRENRRHLREKYSK